MEAQNSSHPSQRNPSVNRTNNYFYSHVNSLCVHLASYANFRSPDAQQLTQRQMDEIIALRTQQANIA